MFCVSLEHQLIEPLDLVGDRIEGNFFLAKEQERKECSMYDKGHSNA